MDQASTNGYETTSLPTRLEPWLGVVATVAIVGATHEATGVANPSFDRICLAVATVGGLALLATHARRLRGLRDHGKLGVMALLGVPIPLILVGLRARATSYFALSPAGEVSRASWGVRNLLEEHHALLSNLGTGVALLGLTLLAIGLTVKLKPRRQATWSR